MKHHFLILVLLILSTIACHKKNDDNTCTAVVIEQVDTGSACSAWAIRVNNTTYISDNIPDEFKRDGLSVCANYELYEDMRLCPCCGGTRANIKSMKFFTR